MSRKSRSIIIDPTCFSPFHAFFRAKPTTPWNLGLRREILIASDHVSSLIGADLRRFFMKCLARTDDGLKWVEMGSM